jgi:hypothetical protein
MSPLPLWERSDRIDRCDPGEGLRSIDRPRPLTPTLSHKGRGGAPPSVQVLDSIFKQPTSCRAVIASAAKQSILPLRGEMDCFAPSNDVAGAHHYSIRCCHAPRRRGIQYAAAFGFYRRRLWNTGSPAGACHRAARCADPVAGDDSERVIQFSNCAVFSNTVSRSRRAIRASFAVNFLPTEIRGRRECRAPDAPAAARGV